MVSIKQYCILLLLFFSIPLMAACSGDGGDEVEVIATATLIPPPGSLPDPTATPPITRTPLPSATPTFTETLEPTITFTPSSTPTPQPITGIIQSLQTVNVRTGPDVSYPAEWALTPGTGVEVLQSNQEGTWYNIRMEDGDEGWIFSDLLFIEDPPTPIPSFTPTIDQTSLALGTGTPIGGGTLTATPPRSVVTATPLGTQAQIAAVPSATNTPGLIPTIPLGIIDQTATAIAGGSAPVASPRPASATPGPNSTLTPAATTSGNSPASTPNPTSASGSTTGPVTVQQGADVFAMCDNPVWGIPAPTNLAAGSTIEVFWAWYVADPQYVQQHLNAVNYEVRINDRLLTNWRQYGQTTIAVGTQFAKYWYVPVGPLEAGNYTITYRATWSERIFDGYYYYGPGTNNLVDEATCTFSVR